jgi:hypothetical protein
VKEKEKGDENPNVRLYLKKTKRHSEKKKKKKKKKSVGFNPKLASWFFLFLLLHLSSCLTNNSKPRWRTSYQDSKDGN